jgi:hypothetical protein
MHFLLVSNRAFVFPYLIILGLFNNAFSSSDYAIWKDMMISGYELEMDVEESNCGLI